MYVKMTEEQRGLRMEQLLEKHGEKDVTRILMPGNEKLGKNKGVWHTALLPITTCPGANGCRLICYAWNLAARFEGVGAAWASATRLAMEQLPAFEAQLRRELEVHVRTGSVSAVRLHESGDFFSAEYTRMWARIADDFPGVRFWAYTRSWKVARLRPALQELRRRANVTLIASVDPHDIPVARRLAGRWRWAIIVEKGWVKPLNLGKRASRLVPCMEQRGTKPDCMSCGYCFKGKRGAGGDVAFLKH